MEKIQGEWLEELNDVMFFLDHVEAVCKLPGTSVEFAGLPAAKRGLQKIIARFSLEGEAWQRILYICEKNAHELKEAGNEGEGDNWNDMASLILSALLSVHSTNGPTERPSPTELPEEPKKKDFVWDGSYWQAVKDYADALRAAAEGLQQRAEKAEADAARVREDAERYRWLREHMAAVGFMPRTINEVRISLSVSEGRDGRLALKHLNQSELDAAIDAARAQSQGTEEEK